MIQKIQVRVNEEWEVMLNNDELCIADSEGRERHRSKGHIMTGMHLAMQLAKLPFSFVDKLNTILKMRADAFKEKLNADQA